MLTNLHAIAPGTASPETITTTLRYADPDKPAGILYAKAMDLSTLSFIYHDDIEIQNGRRSKEVFSLETTGFELVHHETKVTDFESEEQIETIYKPEIEKLLMERTGARRVVLFQAQGRWEDGEARGLRQTAGNAHMDYTVESFRIWVRRLLGEDEGNAAMAAGRWGITTVWRGIKPIERRPLAVCDGRTMDFEAGFKDVGLHLTPDEPQPFFGRNMLYTEDQNWYYFPLMQPDEALLLRQYDSEQDTKASAHSAIDDPTSSPDAAPRASFEIRAVLFY